ncbi:MAG TPA: biotin/lipoyl-binding protein, partial [Tepidisphaeraceae bacterium]|nr:biotin/lipoyl-binding protein [Tepidisphaeraceae bacterium]
MSSKIVEPSAESQASQTVPAAPTRSKVVQRLLDASGDLPTFLNDLVTTQAVHVAGTEAAAFLVERHDGEAGLRLVAHVRPDDSAPDVRAAAVRAFQDLVVPCVRQGKDGAIEVGSPDGGDAQYCLVTILSAEGQVIAVSAVVTRCRDMERAKQRLVTMQFVAGYFELFSLRRYTEHARMMADRHQNVLQFSGAVSNSEGYEAAAMALCNELSSRTGAVRVAMGWVKGKQIKVKALSHTEKFDKKQELVVGLQRVMEECYDQEEPTRYDPDGTSSQNVTRAAADLSRTQGGNIVLSSPLRRRDEIVGVITLEFPPRHKLDEQVEGAVAVAAELLAPQLYDRYENDRYIWVKMGHSIRDLSKMALGPKHMGIKLLILSSIALIAFVCLFSPMYRVRAPFQLVAVDKRTISVPYEGILKEVYFKPGQSVKQGQVLATMDTFQLQIELADAKAEVRSWRERARAAQPDPEKQADYNVAVQQMLKAEESVRLLEYKIAQSEIKAPFNCRILLGELYGRRGVTINKGEMLFEIAKADDANPKRIAVEAELQISERDIQEVQRIHDLKVAGQVARQ